MHVAARQGKYACIFHICCSIWLNWRGSDRCGPCDENKFLSSCKQLTWTWRADGFLSHTVYTGVAPAVLAVHLDPAKIPSIWGVFVTSEIIGFLTGPSIAGAILAASGFKAVIAYSGVYLVQIQIYGRCTAQRSCCLNEKSKANAWVCLSHRCNDADWISSRRPG